MNLRVWGAEKLVRACREMSGSTSGGSAGSGVASGMEGSSTIGTITSSGTSSEMAKKIFCSLHLCLRKYFSSQL
jgi:hypothetical protein